MPIRFFDMFAGIGGFRSGLEAAGGFECVGYCEIDKYARRAYEILYDTKGEKYFDDARKIDPTELPDFDLLTGGFPCQSFSVSGKRLGFSDSRGTLFFEIARIAAAKKPAYLLLENVPGLLSHDRGLAEMSFGEYEGVENCFELGDEHIKKLRFNPSAYTPSSGAESFEELVYEDK